MVDITTLSSALQGLFALQEMLKAGYSVRNANEVAQRVAEVQSQLMPFLSTAVESQQRELTLTQRIRDLEEENIKLKNWGRERERYGLTEISTGVFAYRLKPGMENSEPAHLLCANCFTKDEKVILQAEAQGETVYRYGCPRCGTKLFMTGRPMATQLVRR